MDEVDNDEAIDLTPQIAVAPEYTFFLYRDLSSKSQFLDFLSIK